ncbi:HpcH/HpaI aldolase/citrate lyase family protein [Halobacillus amylolyticus]|uniref:CoA ester lyase n=1 Tax=Halobacillus amylolyticus TaxID=2932259 RepID=A0ABY4HD87_9BACI|nr:CoA ester lyase [Halobacillus amylolyticus]UOR11375.1 CoA ester lyase [Halobacillus amylolyticus]
MKKRSYLFVPANSNKLIEKGLTSEADAVIFDLEDAVALSEKNVARAKLLHHLKTVRCSSRPFVRVNSTESEYFEEDVRTFAALDNIGIMLPKAETKEDIARLETLLDQEDVMNKPILPLIETAKGVWNAAEIASASLKVEALAFGAVDFSLDTNITLSDSGEELLYARSQLVIASRVAGIEAPIDTVYTNFKNSEGFLHEARQVKGLGFQGKLLIHPSQIALAGEIFTPKDEEVEKARRVINAFREAEEKGIAAIEVDGEMVDYPVVRQARKIVNSFSGD